MRIQKQKTIPQRVETVDDKVICDICKKEANAEKYYPWASEPSSIEEVLVEYRSGYHCPGGGNAEIVRFDICPDCFMLHIVPFVEGFGNKRTLVDEDY